MTRLFLLVVFFLLGACHQSNQLSKHQLYVFGTVVDISIWHDDAEEANQAVDQISRKFNQMHHQWHAWKPGRLHEINQSLQNSETIELSDEEALFIKQSIKLSQQSNYFFNPTIGKLINLWGFHTDEYPILTPPPNQLEIQKLVDQSISVNDLLLEDKLLSSDNPNVWLDFGGIAKGYAIDIAIEILNQFGIQDAMINVGGDLRSIGSKGTKSWRVAIQSPKDWSMLAEISIIQDEAIFTSGNYQRFKEFNGKRYAHIIDPRTGMPVDQIISATVIADNGVLADAAATALVVAGDDWSQVADKLNIDQVLIIDESHQCYSTSKLYGRLENLKIECIMVD